MEGISDPQTFELSQTVEKSSKSGIFTNKRLLMIKDGFLYYFSNVPADYKGHEPNLMSTLKEFPKCSIEVRSIQTIKLESAKSSTLVITFQQKDMIDRQDIRKSLSSKNYNMPVKPNSDDLEEWKFIFATVMKCRLWYGSLVKLKQHFVKSQDKFDKFAEYMANFDPQIRSSLPQRASAPITHSPTHAITNNMSPTQNRASNNLSPQSKYKMDKGSGIFQIQQSNEEYDEQITPKNNISTFKEKQKEKEKQKKGIIIQEVPKTTENKVDPKNEVEKDVVIIKEEPLQISIVESVPKKEEKLPQIHYEEEEEKLPPIPQIKPVAQVISEQIIIHLPPSDQSIRSKEASIADEIIKEQAKRQQEQAAIFSQQLHHKEEQIRKMSEEIENNKRAKQLLEEKVREEKQRREEEEKLRMMLEREKREQQEYKRLRESIKSESPMLTQRGSREVVLREESIQTEYERQLIDVLEGGRPQSKLSRYSFKSDLSLNPLTNQRDTLNLFRNTISYISQVKIETHEVENYDYFWQIGQIYRNSDVKERIAKQLQLSEFVAKASRKATDLIVHYIDFNRPREPLTIDRNMFQIQIVCERGRVIRTQGSERLIYPNENHQRLKRCFKIYNQLNEIILTILKKKPLFPLRVPFACLVEYKGYTALAKMTPPLRDNTVNSQYLKLLSPAVPLYNLALSDFECHGAVYSILQPTLYFKVTKEDQTSICRFPQKNHDFLSANRKANISIASKKLFQQAKQVQANAKERLQVAEIITFCRQFKRIMKANTPYTDDSQNQFQFFEDFLKSPSAFMDEAADKEHNISGMLLYYIQKLLGIKMKAKLTPNHTELSYFAVPVKRKFTLSVLDVSIFANNFERYLCDKKYEIAEKSLNYFKQLEEDYSETLLREINMHISLGQCPQALEQLQLCQQLMSIHDPRKLRVLQLQAQCHQAVQDVSHALSTLKTLLEETEYLYGRRSKEKLVEVYFLIADLLSRQGHIAEVIQVYRRILHQSPEYRQKVLLDFAKNLLRQDTDPHVLLDFLQKQLPESISQDNSQVQHLLGQLYYRAKNRPKALTFFTAALSNILAEGKNMEKIYEVFMRGLQCCGSVREKKTWHRQIFGKQGTGGLDAEECRRINTHLCCIIGENCSDSERDNLIIFLEYHKGSAPPKLLEWNWLETILKKLGRGEHASLEEKNILVVYWQPRQKQSF